MSDGKHLSNWAAQVARKGPGEEPELPTGTALASIAEDIGYGALADSEEYNSNLWTTRGD